MWDQGLICFTSSSHWVGSLNCGGRTWHFCACHGRPLACSAGCWGACSEKQIWLGSSGTGLRCLKIWCVADIRIAVRPSCFGSRPMSLASYVWRETRGVGSPGNCAGWVDWSLRWAASEDRQVRLSTSLHGSSVLWRDPSLSESFLTPLVANKAPSSACRVTGESTPAAALHGHGVGLAAVHAW